MKRACGPCIGPVGSFTAIIFCCDVVHARLRSAHTNHKWLRFSELKNLSFIRYATFASFHASYFSFRQPVPLIRKVPSARCMTGLVSNWLVAKLAKVKCFCRVSYSFLTKNFAHPFTYPVRQSWGYLTFYQYTE